MVSTSTSEDSTLTSTSTYHEVVITRIDIEPETIIVERDEVQYFEYLGNLYRRPVLKPKKFFLVYDDY